MSPGVDGNAVIYCQGAYGTTNGKTAHGLVRRTSRYRVLSVIDRRQAGLDAGQVLDGIQRNIPVVADLDRALELEAGGGARPTHLVVGLAPDGGRMSAGMRDDVVRAIKKSLCVDSGLHDFISDDPELKKLAGQHGVVLRDVRKPPSKENLHFFSGKIEKVDSIVVAMLGTDSAVGKRTTAWLLVEALERAGLAAEMVGTGQTAWMQGARYCLVMDSLPNDFVAGEIEHAVYSAWEDRRPDVIVVEGQGSLMHPAYPGGLEILAAARPEAVILQHAPARKEYDGFPGWPLDPVARQIQAIEIVSRAPVLAVTINHENIDDQAIPQACAAVATETGRPAVDVLLEGADSLVDVLTSRFPILHKRPEDRKRR